MAYDFPMDWLALTFISVLFRALYGVLSKVMSSRIEASAYTQATILPLAAAFIALVISPFIGGISLDPAKLNLTAAILVVLGQGLGNILYFASIKNLTNGTAQIAFSSILVFNTLLALIFLNLHLSPLNVFGIVLLMIGILSVVTGKVELNVKGVLLMLLAALCYAVFQLSSAVISKEVPPATYLLIAYLGGALVVVVVKSKLVFQELSQAQLSKTAGIALLTAAPSLGNFIFAYYAYRTAPEPAKVAILLTSQVVVTVFLSYFMLKEKDHVWRKVLAGVLILVAAAVIKS
jgi:drug/metabolite transporter (DMT)-like permease